MNVKTIVFGLLVGCCATTGTALAQTTVVEISDKDREVLKERVRQASTWLNDFWALRFREAGYQYSPLVVVSYLGKGDGGCGSMGPSNLLFYCGTDKKIYFEETELAALTKIVAANSHSDGAEAVLIAIAHEWGHAVRHQLSLQPGTRQPTDKTKSILFGVRDISSETINFASPLAREGEADCLAGAFLSEIKSKGYQRERGLVEAMRLMDKLQDPGPDGSRSELDCLRNAGISYGKVLPGSLPNDPKYYAAVSKCLTMELHGDAHGNDLTRFERFMQGYSQTSVPGFSTLNGPLRCGPLANAWLARSPTKKVDLNTYCTQQFPMIRRAPASYRKQFETGKEILPSSYLSKDIFCLEDALGDVPDH